MGRPTKPLIERSRVVEAAVAIIHAEGERGLSMRTLGKRLAVNPASLYHHFKDKDDILDAVCAYIARKVAPARVASDGWEETLANLAKFYRSQVVSYPNASMLIFHHNQRETRIRYHALYEEVLQSLMGAGFSEERALVALMGTEMVALGSGLSEIVSKNKFDFGVVSKESFPLLYQATRKMKFTARSGFAEFFHLFLLGLAGESEGRLKEATRRRKKADASLVRQLPQVPKVRRVTKTPAAPRFASDLKSGVTRSTKSPE